jgi:LacI family transcriptional regulator
MTENSDRPVTLANRCNHGHARANPTIRDVARAPNVSIGTVSKALNASGRLSAETRAKVLEVAKAIGYRPNDFAQSLHRARSMTVGILSTDSFGRFSFPIVAAIERRLFDQGVAVFMCNATDDPSRDRRHIDQLLGKRVDGLVVTARCVDRREPIEPAAPGLPVVYVFCRVEHPEAFCLLPDDEGGAKLAVRHLAALGRRRIGTITRPERFEVVRLRDSGYRAAVAEAACRRCHPCPAAGRRLGVARPHRNCSRGAKTRPTRCSATLAARSKPCARWVSPSRGTYRWSASTIGT